MTNRFFKGALEKANIQIVSEEVVPRGSTTADPQIQKVRAANPDAIFLAGVLTPENALILRSYRQLGLKQPLLGNYNFSIPVYGAVAKGLLDGLTFVDAFDPAKPQTRQFIENYKNSRVPSPTTSTAMGTAVR